jgi:hypothetical protein
VLDTRGISAFSVSPGDTVTLKFAVQGSGATVAATDSITATMTGYGNLFTNETITGAISGTTGTTFRVGPQSTGYDGINDFDFTATTTPGTYPIVFTYTSRSVDGGTIVSTLTSTATMTVVAPTGFSADQSTSFTNAAGTYDGTEDDEVRVSKASGTDAASIVVTLKNTAGGAYIGGGTLDAQVISGPGLVDVVSAATGYADATTRADTLAIAAGVSSARIAVTSDGTAGVGKIRIRLLSATTGASLGTISEETVYFYGTVATLVATNVYTIAQAGTSIGCISATTCDQADVASTPFVTIVAKDDAGNLVPGLTIAGTIASTGVIAGTSVVAVAQDTLTDSSSLTAGVSTDVNGWGYYNVSVTGSAAAASGSTSTITYATLLSGTTYVTSNPITVTVGGAVKTVTLALDKDSYEAGGAIVVTRTAVDASGNKPYDGQTANAVTFNKPVSGTVAASAYVNGVASTSATSPSIYAPVASGDFMAKMVGSDGVTLITTTASVVGDESSALALDAANAATDAAENAYDEAQNATQAASDALAAVTALAKQVQSLIKQVKKLAKAVSKL